VIKISPYAKAYTAGAAVFLALFDAATSTGSAGGDGVTSAEWVRIAVSVLAAGLGVFLIPNTPDPAGEHRAEP
jgi:hypothetical protein